MNPEELLLAGGEGVVAWRFPGSQLVWRPFFIVKYRSQFILQIFGGCTVKPGSSGNLWALLLLGPGNCWFCWRDIKFESLEPPSRQPLLGPRSHSRLGMEPLGLKALAEPGLGEWPLDRSSFELRVFS